MPSPTVPDVLLGRRLHGDDLDERGLQKWFADEQSGYADLAGSTGDTEAKDDYGSAGASAAPANRFHAFAHLPNRRFARCLALGAASGREYAPLAGRVD